MLFIVGVTEPTIIVCVYIHYVCSLQGAHVNVPGS